MALAADGTTQTQHLPGQQPPHQTNRVHTLVVAGNGNINISQWRVGVAEGNDWDVYIGSFTHRLVVSAGIGDNQQTWLTESSLDLVSECSWCEPASNGCSTSGRGKLQHSTLAVWAGRDDTHIGWVLDGSNGTGSQEQLLPCLAQVQNVHTIGFALVHILFHLEVHICGTQVSGTGKELGYILFFEGKYV